MPVHVTPLVLTMKVRHPQSMSIRSWYLLRCATGIRWSAFISRSCSALSVALMNSRAWLYMACARWPLHIMPAHRALHCQQRARKQWHGDLVQKLLKRPGLRLPSDDEIEEVVAPLKEILRKAQACSASKLSAATLPISTPTILSLRERIRNISATLFPSLRTHNTSRWPTGVLPSQQACSYMFDKLARYLTV